MLGMSLWWMTVPTVLFAMLAACVTAGITGRFEDWAYIGLLERQSQRMTRVMVGFTRMGDTGTVVAFCGALFLVPRYRATIALPIAVAVIVSTILNITLKNLFDRERPDRMWLFQETSYSFPSGHAMVNTSLYAMLLLLGLQAAGQGWLKVALLVVCLLLPLAIGCSRIYLGVHYAADVLGGWLIGFAIAVLVFSGWNATYWLAH